MASQSGYKILQSILLISTCSVREHFHQTTVEIACLVGYSISPKVKIEVAHVSDETT